MKLMLTLKRRAGLKVVEYLDERGHGVIRVPAGAWRAPRREVGGMVPRPDFGASAIARLAAAMVEAKVTGWEPPSIPDGMASGDVTAAVRIVETLMERTAMINHRMLTLKE
jgi:hypothetical protein